jgi:hypothetical protein
LEDEVLEGFDQIGYPLNRELQQMLQESKEHRGGRRGSGFTQASRHLAVFVDRKRSRFDVGVFGDKVSDDLAVKVDAFTENKTRKEIAKMQIDRRDFLDKKKIVGVQDAMHDEGGKLMARMIGDIIEPFENKDGAMVELPRFTKEIYIGTCTTAELYFLEYLDEKIFSRTRRAGYVNIITDKNGRALMIEKIRLGESHSALLLQDVVINGVRIPSGSLMGVQYDPAKEGRVMSIEDCEGFSFLRFTTLVVSPKERLKTFGAHLLFQEENGFPGHDKVRMSEFVERAQKVVDEYAIRWHRGDLDVSNIGKRADELDV